MNENRDDIIAKLKKAKADEDYKKRLEEEKTKLRHERDGFGFIAVILFLTILGATVFKSCLE